MPPLADQPTQQPEALRVLITASGMLLPTSSREEVLSRILDIASEVLEADAYAVWAQCDDLASWKVLAVRGLSPGYRTEIQTAAGRPPPHFQAVEDVHADPSLESHLADYDAEGIRSMVVVPLVLSNQRYGTLTFYWRRVRKFSSMEKDFATALGNLSSSALNTAELHEQNQREKKRLAFLAEASSILASSLDYETTLNRVAHMAVPVIADWCTVHIVDNGTANRIVVAHADPDMLAVVEDFSQRYPEIIQEESGLGLLLRTGQSEILTDIPPELVERAARDADHLAMLRQLNITSSILVPLTSRGKVLGALRLLASGGDRHFTPDDVQLAEDLALRAAAAIENAQLHRAVLKQGSELRLAHAAASMGSWRIDFAHQTVFWSEEFKALHHLSPDAQPSFEAGGALVHPEDRERVLQELADILASPADHLLVEHRFLTHDGHTLWLQSRGSIQRDDHGTPTAIFGISMDVTEQRKAEHALRRADKLAAAGRLAATIAHEINNPLESLTNLVYLAANADDIPPEVRTFLRIADGELKRMAHIVRQTLGFYRESTCPAAVDLGEIVRDAAQLYRSRASTRSVTLSCDCGPGMITTAVAGEIHQVVANLIANAVDACDAGGSVDISVTRTGSGLAIIVADNGSGIPDDNIAHLFEPFFTTKEDVGTGLGLWVSKGIVEKHRGTISVESSTTPTHTGTTFTVTLPDTPPEAV